MPVSIHGKEYKTVAERVYEFIQNTDGCGFIHTELVCNSDDRVVVKAEVGTCSEAGHTVHATGYAEEVRGSTQINKTSALENCETSAVGRALAFAGYAGTEIASADEVAQAVHQQRSSEAATMQAVSGDPKEFICTLKKYRGDKTWGWIIQNDVKYAEWALENLDHSKADWIAIDRIINGGEQ